MSLVRFTTKLMMALATSMIEKFRRSFLLVYTYLPHLPEYLKVRIQNR